MESERHCHSKVQSLCQRLFPSYHRSTLALCYYKRKTCSAHKAGTRTHCDRNVEMAVGRSQIKVG